MLNLLIPVNDRLYESLTITIENELMKGRGCVRQVSW
jgi:hypothetical protein